jgi:hypothetical protein
VASQSGFAFYTGATVFLRSPGAVADMLPNRGGMDVEDLLKIVLVLVIVLLIIEIVGEFISILASIGPVLAVVIIILIVAYFLDYI